jgi:hypothetical protein
MGRSGEPDRSCYYGSYWRFLKCRLEALPTDARFRERIRNITETMALPLSLYMVNDIIVWTSPL